LQKISIIIIHKPGPYRSSVHSLAMHR